MTRKGPDRANQDKLAVTSEVEPGKPALAQLVGRLAERLTLSDSLKAHVASASLDELLFEAESLSQPLESLAETAFYAEIVWLNVYNRFEDQLSADELSQWKKPPQPVHLLKRFDSFLIEQVDYYGSLLPYSHGMRLRISDWKVLYPHLLKRLGEALERNARWHRGERVRRKITPELAAVKKRAKPELRVLFRLVRAEFFKKNRTVKEITDWIEGQVKPQPNTRLLKQYLPAFKQFLLLPEHEQMVLGIATGATKSASFMNVWIANVMNYDIETARQKISKSQS